MAKEHPRQHRFREADEPADDGNDGEFVRFASHFEALRDRLQSRIMGGDLPPAKSFTVM